MRLYGWATLETLRTERIWLKPTNELKELCQLSRRFWNEANGLIYQYQRFGLTFKEWQVSKVLRRGSLLWREFPADSIPEYIVEKELNKSWKAFYAALKSWRANPEKFKARPKPPGFISYKQNGGRRSVTFRDRFCKVKDGNVVIAPTSINLQVETRLPDGTEIRVAKIIPKQQGYLMLVTYRTDIEPVQELDPGRVIGIDLGVIYLATIANNFGAKPLAIPGKELNGYLRSAGLKYDLLKSEHDLRGIKHGNEIQALLEQVDKKKFQVLHTVSSAIINWCVENQVSKIGIGYNEGWKQDLAKKNQLSRAFRRKFTAIPYETLISYIEYKAEAKGIEVKRINEAHTSKCSYFDEEPTEHHETYSGKRKGRIFVRSNGQRVHADLNGAYNIMRRAYPTAIDIPVWTGALSHPQRWPVARVYNPPCNTRHGEGIPSENQSKGAAVAMSGST